MTKFTAFVCFLVKWYNYTVGCAGEWENGCKDGTYPRRQWGQWRSDCALFDAVMLSLVNVQTHRLLHTCVSHMWLMVLHIWIMQF